MTETMKQPADIGLPGLNCGVCGFRTCADLADRVRTDPDLLKRCIHLSRDVAAAPPVGGGGVAPACAGACDSPCAGGGAADPRADVPDGEWRDSLGRDFDFYLEHFPEDPGPREVILPHNPMITRELEIAAGDVLMGRPLGMSCGCPITHCGVATSVEPRTGVITWCVTGPLVPRERGCKDIGYYIAEAYEGLVTRARGDLRVGMRYYFQPRLCMLQWRHSGLLNYLNRVADGWQVRLEGLFIG